jgi:hypothetical protein
LNWPSLAAIAVSIGGAGRVEAPPEDVAAPDHLAGIRPADRERAVGADRELTTAAVEAERQVLAADVGGVDDEVLGLEHHVGVDAAVADRHHHHAEAAGEAVAVARGDVDRQVAVAPRGLHAERQREVAAADRERLGLLRAVVGERDRQHRDVGDRGPGLHVDDDHRAVVGARAQRDRGRDHGRAERRAQA